MFAYRPQRRKNTRINKCFMKNNLGLDRIREKINKIKDG